MLGLVIIVRELKVVDSDAMWRKFKNQKKNFTCVFRESLEGTKLTEILNKKS